MRHFASRAVVYVTLNGTSETEPPEGEYIAIKAALSLAEQAELQGSMVGMDEDQKVKMNPTDYLRRMNEVAIVGWRLFEDGEPVPFSRERIGELDCNDPLVDAALKEFAERNPMRARSSVSAGSTK